MLDPLPSVSASSDSVTSARERRVGRGSSCTCSLAGDAILGTWSSATAALGRVARVGRGRGVGIALISISAAEANKSVDTPTFSAGAVKTEGFSTVCADNVCSVTLGAFFTGDNAGRANKVAARLGEDRAIGEVDTGR